MKGNRIHSMDVKQLEAKFLNSNNYIQGDEYQIAQEYNIAYERIFFPQNINFDVWKEYCGEVPNQSYFNNFDDSEEIRTEKEIFCFKQKNKQWIFMEQLGSYSAQKVFLLCKAICSFSRNCFEFQKNLMEDVDDFNKNKNKFIHPFQENLTSFPAFIFQVFKAFYCYNEDLYSVMNEYGGPLRTTSKFEHQLASFLEFENPEKMYRHSFNHPKGQKYFKECIPDLYSAIFKEAVFLNGCYIHGHLDCLDNPNASKDFKNFTSKSNEDLNLEFNKKLEKLKKIMAQKFTALKFYGNVNLIII